MDDPIFCELKLISIATGTSVKWYNPKSFPSFTATLELSFSRIMHAQNIAKTHRDFCSAQPMQLLLWPAYSPDMLPIEHVWVWLVGVAIVIRVLQLQKTNFCCAYKQCKIIFHKQTFNTCLTPCPVV
ncbi:UNVERIFIED_CONTAM: hypothetical protein NCL1_36266 [Trichonephila clavipes]